MLTSDLDYDLPPELIAQHPAVPRDSSRMLVYDRATSEIRHHHLTDLPGFLAAGDVMVYNDSRVIRARVKARRGTGGRVELLFLRRREPGVWEALVKPSARLGEGEELFASNADEPGSSASVTPSSPLFRLKERLGGGRWLVANASGLSMEVLLEKIGEMPLPPYIKEPLKESGRYQTVYACEPGSAAAPTAGLHFTPELMESARAAGAGFFPVTLHIGLDTFRPVTEDELESHVIHKEHYLMPEATMNAILDARERGGRVLAVGTTSVRVLETVFEGRQPQAPGPGAHLEGETGIFITPGFRFRAVDALLTNFHLPRSTLLALVMAFAGVEETRRIYSEAVRERYRFFSFGDAMLII